MADGPDERPSWERDTESTEAGAARDEVSSGDDAAADDADAGVAGSETSRPEIPDSVSAFDLLPGYHGGLTGPSLTRPGADTDAARRGHPPTGPDNEVITNVVDEVPVSAGAHSAFRDVFGDIGIVAETDDAGETDAGGEHRSERAPGPRRRGSAQRPGSTQRPRSTRQDGRRRRDAGILTLVIVVALLALVALFVFGTQLPRMLGATPAPTPTHSATPTPTPTPTVTPVPTAARESGAHRWNTLAGGECLDPYDSPWAQTFTVVDCSTPHAAQVVAAGLLSTDIGDTYPGADDVAAAATKDCDKNGVIDLKAASGYSDLQVQASYPATEKQWDAGERTYYCFADLASGKSITGSVAGSAH